MAVNVPVGAVDSAACAEEDGRYRPEADLEAVDMTPMEGETRRLRELHELYVWQVNAAVEEGRDDLVAELADEYFEVALAELAVARPEEAGAGAPTSDPTDLEGGPDPGRISSTDARRWEVVDCRPEHVPWWRRLLPH
jgi:hypothetical protein